MHARADGGDPRTRGARRCPPRDRRCRPRSRRTRRPPRRSGRPARPSRDPRLLRPGDRVVEHVDAVADRVVDRRRRCPRSCTRHRPGRGRSSRPCRPRSGPPARPPSRGRRLRRRRSRHPVVAGGDRGGVRAVAGAVARGDELRLRDVAGAEALDEVPRRDRPWRCSRSRSTPRRPGRRRGTRAPAATGRGTAAGGRRSWGSSGQMPLSTKPITTPLPAWSGASWSAKPSVAPASPAGPAVVSVCCRVLFSTSTTPGVARSLFTWMGVRSAANPSRAAV